MDWLSNWRRKRRERRILRECGCVCWCPQCREPLNDQEDAHDTRDGLVAYRCASCGNDSEWLFDAPVPILIGRDPRSTAHQPGDGAAGAVKAD